MEKTPSQVAFEEWERRDDEKRRRLKPLAQQLEDFARRMDHDSHIAPSLSRLPKADDTWIGFLHDAETIERALQQTGLPQADFDMRISDPEVRFCPRVRCWYRNPDSKIPGIVVLTDTGQGCSVTNCFESIVHYLDNNDLLEYSPQTFWIEHYVAGAHGAGSKESFDFVFFDEGLKPKWRPLTKRAVITLIEEESKIAGRA